MSLWESPYAPALIELLGLLTDEKLKSLASSLTTKKLVPVNREEAMKRVLYFTKSLDRFFSYKKITKEVLIDYLTKKNVPVRAMVRMKELIDVVREELEKSKTNNSGTNVYFTPEATTSNAEDSSSRKRGATAPSPSLRAEAAKKCRSDVEIITESVGKKKPNIIIPNVGEEENKEKIKETILGRNKFLRTIEGVEDKIKLVRSFHRNGKMHYILECDPTVRRLIHENFDKLTLEFGTYTVKDYCYLLMCFHCQRYGHKLDKCPFKTNGDLPHCFKCAGKHESRHCTTTEKKMHKLYKV